MPERLRASDFRFIAICLAMLAGTVWFCVRNYHYAFPEASIDFRVNRQDALALAGRFLGERGYRVGDYREASRFNFDDQAKTFLEREIGLERANQIMGTRLHLWRWSYRWFRPQQKEEYRVDVTTRGEVVGFEHQIPEAAARPSLSPEQARAMAEEFLKKEFHRDPATLEFVENSSVSRPARTDQVFIWKERDFNLKDATYRVEVTILGNEPGSYNEYLKVPDQWSRDYERLRSRNEVTQYVDTAVVLVLFVGHDRNHCDAGAAARREVEPRGMGGHHRRRALVPGQLERLSSARVRLSHNRFLWQLRGAPVVTKCAGSACRRWTAVRADRGSRATLSLDLR